VFEQAALRPAQLGDWAGVWPLLQGMGQVESEAQTRQRFRRVIANETEFLPVAELGGILVGYAWAHQGPVHLRAGRSTVRMSDLFVAPEWRRKGIGRLLVDAVVRWARERRADWLEWQASQSAAPFYERLGYVGDPCPDPDHPFFEITLAPDLRSP